MDEAYAREMSSLTRAFYDEVFASFSATRQRPWAGWDRLAHELGLTGDESLRVLDVACGNLRFERFLAGRVRSVEAWCTDGCDELVLPALSSTQGAVVHYVHADVAEALLTGELQPVSAACPQDLAVSFGFMHHLPLAVQRRRLLAHLTGQVRVGGHVCVSFWQFDRDERIMRAAMGVPGGGEGDYLLGWQGSTSVRRFCHATSDSEIDRLVDALGGAAVEVTRFSADGKSGDLNRYLVLRRSCQGGLVFGPGSVVYRRGDGVAREAP